MVAHYTVCWIAVTFGIASSFFENHDISWDPSLVAGNVELHAAQTLLQLLSSPLHVRSLSLEAFSSFKGGIQTLFKEIYFLHALPFRLVLPEVFFPEALGLLRKGVYVLCLNLIVIKLLHQLLVHLLRCA